jgi:hypothetical protein
MDRGLLVDDLDGPDLVLSVEQRVGEVPGPVTGDAGDDRDALPDEVLDHDLGARQPGRDGPIGRSGLAQASLVICIA